MGDGRQLRRRGKGRGGNQLAVCFFFFSRSLPSHTPPLPACHVTPIEKEKARRSKDRYTDCMTGVWGEGTKYSRKRAGKRKEERRKERTNDRVPQLAPRPWRPGKV